MKMGKFVFSTALVIGALSIAQAIAEDNTPPPPPPPPPNGGAQPNPGGPNGPGGMRRQFDPEQMRKMMLDRIKERLGLSDDEMKALQPKFEAVQKLQLQVRGGFGFGRRRPQENAGGNPPAPDATPDVGTKTQELQALLDNKDTDTKALQDKLKDLRDLRDKTKVDLKKAQDDLRELLTPRQEAQLVLMGLIE